MFKEIYGQQYVNSNLHNLVHLVDDVDRFGELDSFIADRFENMLGKMKNLLRNGNQPLAQVGNRYLEIIACTLADRKQSQDSIQKLSKKNDGANIPKHLKSNENITFYSKIQLEEFCLSSNTVDCWFLFNNYTEVGYLHNIMSFKGTVKLCCSSSKIMDIFFEVPIDSRHLNIFCTNKKNVINSEVREIDICEISCKLVCLQTKTSDVFIPLLHTNILTAT